jgi:hypothetical protein
MVIYVYTHMKVGLFHNLKISNGFICFVICNGNTYYTFEVFKLVLVLKILGHAINLHA